MTYMTLAPRRRMTPLLLFFLTLFACENEAEVSAQHAARHVEHLVAACSADVAEIRSGLPAGATLMEELWKEGTSSDQDLGAARDALLRVRDKVQDLRVAKSTFFALVAPNGTVLRNDQEQDRMAGKAFLASFPAARKALDGTYAEAIGSMKEASGIAGPRVDAQWVAAAPVRAASGVRALYVTGFSLSSYAYRLEFKLRGEIRSELSKVTHQTQNEPLVYAFVVVGDAVYGAPAAPDINLETLAKLELLRKTKSGAHRGTLSITGRDFGIAAMRAPALGPEAAIAVLRSET